MVAVAAPTLLAIPCCGVLTAVKIIGETAGIDRFKSKDAYARHHGSAPMPVWSSNKTHHRLSRTGNRQLNAALHRIAMTQAHRHPPAIQMMNVVKPAATAGEKHSVSSKRRISDVVYAALRADSSRNPERQAA